MIVKYRIRNVKTNKVVIPSYDGAPFMKTERSAKSWITRWVKQCSSHEEPPQKSDFVIEQVKTVTLIEVKQLLDKEWVRDGWEDESNCLDMFQWLEQKEHEGWSSENGYVTVDNERYSVTSKGWEFWFSNPQLHGKTIMD